MLEQKTGIPQSGQPLLPGKASNTPRQERVMLAALLLLLVSLTAVLYRDRDFWFPDTEADDQLLATPQTQDTQAKVPANAVVPESPKPESHKKRKRPKHEAVEKKLKSEVSREVSSDPPPSAGPSVTTTRTVLPPLEVEVVAGDARRTVRPGTNAVHVDLQRPTSGQSYASIPDETTETPARVASPTAQRTGISTDAASLVSHSVKPDYPMLARQMRVQGSVVLQALIGRDGLIQDLRILSGPHILATAAEEAVRQWHFKPHFVGSEPVETRANITVNFTISTN
jgi:TonB family protein